MNDHPPVLFIFSGRPGAGKTTLARRLAAHFKATYLRIDTIEQAIRDLCDFRVQGEGYRLTYRVVADNLKVGNHVVSDASNPIELTRDEWEQAATNVGGDFLNIQVICSDEAAHQERILTRPNDIPGLNLPDWETIQKREYHDWTRPRIQVDTAGNTEEESFRELLDQIRALRPALFTS